MGGIMNLKNNKVLKQDSENTIKKSNEISMADMSNGLTLNQLQLLAYAIYATQKSGVTEFRKAEFEKKFELKNYTIKEAKEDVDKITSLKFNVMDLENERFSFQNLFIGMNYDKGLFYFKFNPDLVHHILDLKEKYITTDLTIASKFKSGFSWRLYDFLKANYGLWYKNFTKQDLMQLFNVQNTKTYIRDTSVFKKIVLDKAISEINALTEYQVHYKEQKEGRAIVGFTLIWTIGKTMRKCTKKQIEDAERVCETILDQALDWIDLQGKEDREHAKTLVRRTQEISLQIAPNLTAERLAELQNTLQSTLNELERLKEHQEQESDAKPIFYNWLDERE